MKSATNTDYAQEESSVHGQGEIHQGAAAKPKFVTETIKLGKGNINQRPDERAFDWQGYVKQHPYLTLGLAATGGALLVRLLNPRPSAKKRLINSFASNAAGASRQLGRGISNLAEKPARAATPIKAAMATIVGKAFKTYLKRKLIGTLTPHRKRRLFS